MFADKQTLNIHHKSQIRWRFAGKTFNAAVEQTVDSFLLTWCMQHTSTVCCIW